MRRITIYGALALTLAPLAPYLQGLDQKAQLQKDLISKCALTTITQDKSDIVNAGGVLALRKSGLLMYATSNPIPPQSSYKKGKITRNPFGKGFWSDLGNSMAAPGSSAAIAQRTFVTGEKLWLTKVDVKDDGVIFGLFSDPIDEVRYYGELKVPFPKGQVPTTDDLLKTLAELFTVESADSPAAGDTTAENPPAPDNAETPPKTIALGQTKDEVVAALGQPQKIVNLGAKELYLYPDMKVTFMNGKVADVK
jgi:hypothetical protein